MANALHDGRDATCSHKPGAFVDTFLKGFRIAASTTDPVTTRAGMWGRGGDETIGHINPQKWQKWSVPFDPSPACTSLPPPLSSEGALTCQVADREHSTSCEARTWAA
eukprot:1580697-Rhodomonas_salina.2